MPKAKRGMANLIVWPVLVGGIVAAAWFVASGTKGERQQREIAEELAMVDAIDLRWSDVGRLIESTPRLALAPQVERAQAIAREYSALGLRTCASEVARRRGAAAAVLTDSYLAFLAGNGDRAASLRRQGDIEGLHAMFARSNCDPGAKPMGESELQEMIDLRRAF